MKNFQPSILKSPKESTSELVSPPKIVVAVASPVHSAPLKELLTAPPSTPVVADERSVKKITIAEYKKKMAAAAAQQNLQTSATLTPPTNLTSSPSRMTRSAAAAAKSFIPILRDMPSTSITAPTKSSNTTPHPFNSLSPTATTTQNIDLDELKERILNPPKRTATASRVGLYFINIIKINLIN